MNIAKRRIAYICFMLLLLQAGCGNDRGDIKTSPIPGAPTVTENVTVTTDTPVPTKMSSPTDISEPEATVAPENTVTPTLSAPTEEAAPTASAKVTDTPAVTVTPEPTDELPAAPSAEPTEEVLPSETGTPVPTEEATGTSTPVPSETAEPTEAPEATATEAPEVTATAMLQPTATSTPIPTEVMPTPTATPIAQDVIEAERKAIIAKGLDYTSANLEKNEVEKYTFADSAALEEKFKYLVFNDISCFTADDKDGDDSNNNLTYYYPQIAVFYKDESTIETPSQIMEKYPEAGKVFIPDTRKDDTPEGKTTAVQRFANGTLVFYCATPVEENARISYYFRTGDKSIFWDASGFQKGDGGVDQAVADKIVSVSEELKLAELTVPEVIKAVHDYLVDTITYDHSSEGADPSVNIAGQHTAYAALINNKAVCDGYSKAFQLFMTYNGIPCIDVAGYGKDGKGHEWNQVYYAGSWYHVDCTWDDAQYDGNDSGRIYYDYFMVSDNIIKNDHTYYASEKPHLCEDDSFIYYAFEGKIMNSGEDADSIIDPQLDNKYVYFLYDKENVNIKDVIQSLLQKWNLEKCSNRPAVTHGKYEYLVVWKN